MTAPAPRPALRKAADAHIHPAAPGHTAHTLRPASLLVPADVATLPEPRTDGDSRAGAADSTGTTQVKAAGKGTATAKAAPHRLSGPPSGTTSDSLRAGSKAAGGGRGRPHEKSVEITFKVPKSLSKEFRAAVKADKKDPDDVAATLLRAWLHG